MRRTRLIVLSIIAAAMLGGWFIRDMLPGARIDEAALLSELLPGVVFSEKAGSPPHYLADDGTVAFNSYDIVPEIRGYAGPIKTLVVLDPSGTIRGVSILSHRETKNYVHSMLETSYLASFIGLSVNANMVPGEPGGAIDAISRATVSVDALADTVRSSSRTVASGVLGLEVVSSKRRGSSGSFAWLAMLALFAVALVLSRVRPGGWERDIILVASVIVVGLWLSSPFAALHAFNVLLGRVSSDPLWLVVVIGTAASVAFRGRLYCGWLCPLGAILEFAGRLRLRKWSVNIEQDEKYRKVKYPLLVIMAVLVLTTGQPGYVGFEPYVTLFSFNGTALAWSVLLVSLVGGLWVSRFWCRYLCPAGALLALASPARGKYVSSANCPMGNPPGRPVEGNTSAGHVSECIVCGKCIR